MLKKYLWNKNHLFANTKTLDYSFFSTFASKIKRQKLSNFELYYFLLSKKKHFYLKINYQSIYVLNSLI